MSPSQEAALVFGEMLQAKGLSFEDVADWLVGPWIQSRYGQRVNYSDEVDQRRRKAQGQRLAAEVLPMYGGSWRWWAGSNPEKGVCKTREEALKAADDALIAAGFVFL